MRRLECIACRAPTKAACNCGVGYEWVAVAVSADPNKSDRAHAADLGVDKKTVARARKKGGGDQSPPDDDRRTGKDGKSYPAKRKNKKRVDEINGFHRELMGFMDKFSERFKAWHKARPKIDADGKAELMQALYLCSDGFARLAQSLDGR